MCTLLVYIHKLVFLARQLLTVDEFLVESDFTQNKSVGVRVVMHKNLRP